MLKDQLSYWKERLRSLSAYLVILAVVIGAYMVVNKIFNRSREATSQTRTRVESGGIANITNINNPAPNLKHGLYVRGASDRASVGVFKEVLPNMDISLGAGKDYEDDAFVEAELRLKF